MFFAVSIICRRWRSCGPHPRCVLVSLLSSSVGLMAGTWKKFLFFAESSGSLYLSLMLWYWASNLSILINALRIFLFDLVVLTRNLVVVEMVLVSMFLEV